MIEHLKKNWFMVGLIVAAAIPAIDFSEITVLPGLWLKSHRGPDLVIVLIFFLSGMALDTRQVKEGIADYTSTLVALLLIFIIAPLTAFLFTHLGLPTGIIIGLLIVAVMPTTLSSGVVMTGASGGNMAHALVVTIVANSLAVITIPLSLETLLHFTGESRIVNIDQLPMMIKIGALVLLPLLCGLTLRNKLPTLAQPLLPHTTRVSQIGILSVVWMASCQGRSTIVSNLDSIVIVLLVTFSFHLILLMVGMVLTRIFRIGKGRRESVIFMGTQKTLPLSLILQVSLFPEFGVALVVCVLHHITHLAMDGFLVPRLKASK